MNSFTNRPTEVTATDLGYQPSYDLCAELCATFWRKGKQRCVAFDWRMSNHDCEYLKDIEERNALMLFVWSVLLWQDKGLLPQHTKTCGYSNSGPLNLEKEPCYRL